MCGIIACIGENCEKTLMDGLEQLQNRGYDSAGISTIKNNEFLTHKFSSEDNENALIKLNKSIHKHKNSTIGIGHTRWATHGSKVDRNSHPHISNNKLFSLVHNGIISNYSELKNKLLEFKYFKSDTDSEVIVNLLEYNYEMSLNNNPKNKSIKTLIANVIKNTLSELEGSWGLAILCTLLPKYIFVVRKGSPLLVSLDTNSNIIVTSERSGFCGKINNYISLDNNDICMVSKETGIETCNSYIPIKNKYLNYDLTPNPYKYWLEKEINDQKTSCLNAINLGGRLIENKVKLGGLELKKVQLKEIDNIIILGCGTSYNAGCIGVNYFKTICNFNTVQAYDGAEFSDIDIPRVGKTAFIFLSQSGETKDLINCIDIGKKNNILLIGIINVVDSYIARETDCGCYLNAGREVSVASTKSFTSQVILLSMVAIWFAQLKNINENIRLSYIKDLRRLHIDINNCIINLFNSKKIDEVLDFFCFPSCFILGKQNCEHIAREGALKIKEISYIHAEGYSTSSLKHGPFALLESDFPVIICAPFNENYDKVMNAYEEIKARGGKIILISDYNSYNSYKTYNKPKQYTNLLNNMKHITQTSTIIHIPHNKSYNDLLCVFPLQILALKLALSKKINPDIPRNLAKVVTVD
tara:strand:- start:59 stop:1981 length:1923 start_codon:yes stop_codon:yes gene_type:complete